jgi:hypothetical protein
MSLAPHLKEIILRVRTELFWVITQRSDNSLPTFWDNLPVPYSRIPLTLEDRLSRNVGKELSLLPRTHFSSGSRRKPEIIVFEGDGEQVAEGVVWT